MDEEIRGRRQALEHLWEEGRRAIGADQRFVPGEGSPVARLMLIGEAPGKEEAEQGRPFVGRSGQLLNRVLQKVGIARDQVWVTNVFKARPTIERGGRIVNRQPTAAEIRTGERLLRQEIQIIRPRIIVCLGSLAARAIIARDFGLSEGRGKWNRLPDGVVALATFHPAYILRQRGAERDRLMALFEQDFRAAKEALERCS